MRAPTSILFLCGKNSIRSPMAHMLAKSLLPKSIFIQSAGIEQGDRDFFVDSVLDEIGLDLGDRQPRLVEDVGDDSFDVVIAMTKPAHQKAQEIYRTAATEILYWPTSDPTTVQGRRDQVLMAYREVRETIKRKITDRFLS